jgi:signal transduction histidine kinase
VCVRAEAADDETVRVAVSDDGPGLPAEAQERIFEKFTQARADDVGGGSGLGLAVCREIIERHGGRISVDSAPGAGATFTFTLPLAREKSNAARHGDPSSDGGPPRPAERSAAS